MLSLTGILSSFTGGGKSSGKSTDWIPADFDPRHGVLLVQNFYVLEHPNKNLKKVQDKVSNDMKAEMQDSYPYKFEMVDVSEINTGSQYADKDKYRWVLMSAYSEKESKFSHETGNGQTARNWSTPQNVFHIYDRKTNKHYPDSGRPNADIKSAMRPTIGAIVDFLRALK